MKGLGAVLTIGERWRRRTIDSYFARGVSGRRETAMRAHMAGCAGCRERYARHLAIEQALPDGESRAADRLWAGIVEASTARPSGRQAFPKWALAVAVVALFLAAPWPVRAPHSRDPTPRGTNETNDRGLRPSIHLFRALDGARSEPVADIIHRGEGLLLAYSNPGSEHSYLMVFAVDERYETFWFYPAYQNLGDDPSAIPIEPSRSGVELAEVIKHEHISPGRLRVFALFLKRPERVLTIERLIQSELARPARSLEENTILPVQDAHQESLLLQVAP